ncbi:MAG: exodeoxyribonuclease III [Thiobacillus sp.]|nr:exodeoxyribonuclease III [Thiobacillus sp.]
MKLVTWNVNSLKVRLPQLLDWLPAAQPDVVCLQETKLTDEAFPQADIEAAGYRAVFSGQKTYNGVAILSRHPLMEVQAGIPGFEDEQKRVLAATVGDGDEKLRVICVYIPNGQSLDSDKYQYKLRWLDALIAWLKDELNRHPRLALLGDYNIAPEDRDVHDPLAWEGNVLVSEPERARFRALLALGLKDAFRLFEQPEKSFSWWDYRAAGFRRNLGLRIDHILLSSALAGKCTACVIDKEPRKLERPSDHTPVLAELDLTGS